MTAKATAMEAVEAIQAALDKYDLWANSTTPYLFTEACGAVEALNESTKPDNIRTVLASLAASQAEVVVLREALTEARWAVAAFVREIKPEHATNPLPDSVLARIDAALTQGAQS